MSLPVVTGVTGLQERADLGQVAQQEEGVCGGDLAIPGHDTEVALLTVAPEELPHITPEQNRARHCHTLQ